MHADARLDIVEEAGVTFVVTKVVAGREGMAGVDADPEPIRFGDGGQDRFELLEIGAQRGALPGRVLQQDLGAESWAFGVDAVEGADDAFDARGYPLANVRSRVEHEAGNAEAAAALELVGQSRHGLLEELVFRAGQVDEVRGVGDDRNTGGLVCRAELGHLVVADRLAVPAVGVLDEDLDRLAADVPAALESLGCSPGNGHMCTDLCHREQPTTTARRLSWRRGAGVKLGRVVRAQRLNPAPAELVDFLDEYLRAGDCLVQVVSRCELLYSGRAASVAEAGDYLVMVKRDGSVQVHGEVRVKPVNWQPHTDDLFVGVEDGLAVLRAERFTPAEMLRVAFLEPALVQALRLEGDGDFVLIGSEAEMQRVLARRPDVIEEGLTVLDRELPTDVGGIDLFARDRDGALVVVELKRSKATQEAVHQLGRYVEAVRRTTTETVRGILAAPAATAPALAQLGRLGLDFREVTALPDMDEAATTQPSMFATR